MAENSPTLLYSYVGQIIESIWVALRDPRLAIRVDAADALSACLKIIFARDSVQRQQWYNKILEEAQSGFKTAITETIHGSLLVYRELLGHAGMFMQPRYIEVCDTVLRYKDHKDPLIRRTVIMILPDLAKYNPVEFTKRYLVDCTAHLIGQLKKEKDRGLVFLSIGNIAVSVRSNMTFYLEPILENVREGLMSKGYVILGDIVPPAAGAPPQTPLLLLRRR
ncbi:phosphatidylinositol kinase-related protein kinase TOR2 [Sugiyamaella lignohabitans]|uniref:Phosphatidylinositol kinase-related protein kinase TOR2 n=1 Tax=Sugiyamaella lignohabitans TaxID=796027 RepID=A0A167FE82_9ASCO|nr:phosphatidylinositol kinase-related protein kinase TOR2 [Sugiyamaella lignohabitans]ANB15188.1 phosphatidylinositol kinase-related protein kinase TOR2 [Sugiyamaella lignohabitans]